MAMLACIHGGATMALPSRPRPTRPTRDQIRAGRYALWLHAFEVGLPVDLTARVVRYTHEMIAERWDVTTKTVQRGLAEARRLRALVEGVRDAD